MHEVEYSMGLFTEISIVLAEGVYDDGALLWLSGPVPTAFGCCELRAQQVMRPQ